LKISAKGKSVASDCLPKRAVTIRSKKLDAPSWLWTSIVELVARHESAYLEHCRQYALNAAQSR
jgi:uncharacterized protein (DUF2252 family)